MTRDQAVEAIYQMFIAGWTDGGQPRTAITLDGEKFDPPAAPWVRLTVRHTTRAQASLGQPGNRRWDTEGIVFLQYFEPPDSGVARMHRHMDAAQQLFEGRSIAGTTIKLDSATARELGLVENGTWMASVLEAAFSYEQVK